MLIPRLKYFFEARRYKNIASALDCTTRPTSFNKEQVTFFMHIFDLNYLNTYNLLMKHTNLRLYDQDRLQKAFEMCKTYGFTTENIKECPQILTVLPNSVEHHNLILQEAGFDNITTSLIKNYPLLMKRRISILKAYAYIPQNVNVQEKFLTYLPDVTSSLLEIPSPQKEDILYNVRQNILRKYLMWRLNLNLKEMDHMYSTYPRIRNKSFRLMIKTLDLLENDLGFTKDKIKRNGYLVHGHHENITNMITKIKTLGGEDIKIVLLKQPKILLTNYETVAATAQHLKDFNISNAAIRRCYEIFTLSSKSVMERLLDLKTIPEFHVLSSHPRILRLVHYQKKAISRLSYLQQLRVNCASLHIITSSKEQFYKYARDGGDKTKGKDIILFLSKHLKQNSTQMRVNLNRHPFWCNVPLVTIEQTVMFLRKKHFSNEDIYKNIHIVLYPKEYVQEQLNNLHLLETNQNKCQTLALCLYYIEQKHHFTGNGIWHQEGQTDAIVTPDVISPLPPDEYSQSHHYRYGLKARESIK